MSSSVVWRASGATELCCPVCRARWRATRECSRCGADLGPLMTLVVLAHRVRCEAKAALLGEDFERAGELARRAQEMHATPYGRRLELLVEWYLALAPAG